MSNTDMRERPQIVPPSDHVTEEMVRFAQTEYPWHTAANLNAMMQQGYCRVCGLVPIGCKREGCGPNIPVGHDAPPQQQH